MFRTPESLHSKTLTELKSLASELKLFPVGDKRCRQNWIEILVGTLPPLLKLLEVSPAVKTDFVSEAIAPAVETSPGVETDLVSEAIASAATFNDEHSPNRRDGREHLLETEQKLSQSAIAQVIETSPDCSPVGGITFSAKFLATYTPYFGANHKVEPTGQLNLLELVETVEPPDLNDFDCMFHFWAAYDAWVAADTEQKEGFISFPPLEVSPGETHSLSEAIAPLQVFLDSFSQWAAIPDSWYESKVSEVLEFLPGNKSFNICKFLIPVFDLWCDRQNDGGLDQPPDIGNCARSPRKPPPSFSPNTVVSDRTNDTKKFVRRSILASGRAPPGGDTTQM
ncbi:MAG: hypothetical protein ACBR12_00950 [Microcoleus sp.]